MDSARTLALTAELSYQGKTLLPISLPSILVDFRCELLLLVLFIFLAEYSIVGFALSGLSVQQLTVLNESYKPYKGLRRITKSGNYEIRPYS